jgi:hypothetical protein
VLLNRLLLGAVVRHHAEVVEFQIVVGEVFHIARTSARLSAGRATSPSKR